jgi:S-adenosylmethionine-diacylglycerol 3-amino-3-carboxypropyl transferase
VSVTYELDQRTEHDQAEAHEESDRWIPARRLATRASARSAPGPPVDSAASRLIESSCDPGRPADATAESGGRGSRGWNTRAHWPVLGSLDSLRPALPVDPALLRWPERAVGVVWDRERILFSSCNEDTNSEHSAFGSLEGRRVFCVTAGGGRVLSLLPARPAEIWAVDLNPAQNHLLELKVESMRALDHASYLRFLGVRRAIDRLRTYDRLRPQLSSAARRFFDHDPALIDGGVLLQGRLERYLKRVALALRLAEPIGTRRLFAFNDIEAQRRFLGRLDRKWFRAIAELMCRRSTLQAFSGDPGFYRYVPRSVPLHRVIYDGMLMHFRCHLARDNPLFQLIFFGRWIHEPALPIYLNAATYDRARAALGDVRLVTVTGMVSSTLADAGPGAFDAFSLSDISSYLDDDAHGALFDHVLRAARPGAKLCSRSNIVHRPLSREQALAVQRDSALERRLAISDHSCVHKFLAGTIR